MVWKHQVVLVHFNPVHLEEKVRCQVIASARGPKNGPIGIVQRHHLNAELSLFKVLNHLDYLNLIGLS